MLDRSFGDALRNFATLFLLVAAVTVPLHLVYSVIFQNVIETRELHSVIAEFPSARQVHGVGTMQLAQARIALLVISIIEIAAIPWLARATAYVLDSEPSGRIPLVGEALRKAGSPLHVGNVGWARRPGPLLVATLIALLVGVLIERSGLALLEFVPDASAYPFFGLMQGVARAAGAPFLLATIVLSARAKDLPPKKPTLY